MLARVPWTTAIRRRRGASVRPEPDIKDEGVIRPRSDHRDPMSDREAGDDNEHQKGGDVCYATIAIFIKYKATRANGTAVIGLIRSSANNTITINGCGTIKITSQYFKDDKMDQWSFDSDSSEVQSWLFGRVSADSDLTPPAPPSSPERHSDGEDVWTMDKENFDCTAFDIDQMPIEILTVGSLIEMDPSGEMLNALLTKKLKKKKRKRKKKNNTSVIRPLRL